MRESEMRKWEMIKMSNEEIRNEEIEMIEMRNEGMRNEKIRNEKDDLPGWRKITYMIRIISELICWMRRITLHDWTSEEII